MICGDTDGRSVDAVAAWYIIAVDGDTVGVVVHTAILFVCVDKQLTPLSTAAIIGGSFYRPQYSLAWLCCSASS